MTRNAAFVRSPQDSFANVLEGAAQPVTAKRAGSDSPSQDGRWNKEALKRAVHKLQTSDGQAAGSANPLSRKPLQVRKEAEISGNLSYERALRLLARVDLSSDDSDWSPDTSSDSSLELTQASRATGQTRSLSETDRRPIQGESGSDIQNPNSSRRRSKARQSSDLASNMPNTTKRGSAQTRKGARSVGHPEVIQHSSETKLSGDNFTRDLQKATVGTVRKASIGTRKTKASLRKNAEEDVSLEAISRESQRRTIVSLRLTDYELEQLRVRAEQSGINVSSYVRSCVMEAETLRSQVRLVVAEMRALGAASIGQQYALASASEQTNIAIRQSWMTSLRKLAASLCTEPFRRFRRHA